MNSFVNKKTWLVKHKTFKEKKNNFMIIYIYRKNISVTVFDYRVFIKNEKQNFYVYNKVSLI